MRLPVTTIILEAKCSLLLFVGLVYYHNVFFPTFETSEKPSYHSFSVSTSGVQPRTFKTSLVIYFEVLATTLCDLAHV